MSCALVPTLSRGHNGLDDVQRFADNHFILMRSSLQLRRSPLLLAACLSPAYILLEAIRAALYFRSLTRASDPGSGFFIFRRN